MRQTCSLLYLSVLGNQGCDRHAVNCICLYVLGKLVAGFCPSVSGCRAVVEFKDVTDMQSIEVTDEQLRLAFNSSHADVWLVTILRSGFSITT